MKEHLPDPDTVISQVSQVTKLCLSLRQARRESEKESLLERFTSFISLKGESEPPDDEVLFVGYHDLWMKKDFAAILRTEKMLPKEFLNERPELLAYIEFARRKSKDPER
jgi:hypothetical protein